MFTEILSARNFIKVELLVVQDIKHKGNDTKRNWESRLRAEIKTHCMDRSYV